MSQKTRDLLVVALLATIAGASLISAFKASPAISTFGLSEAVKDALRECKIVEQDTYNRYTYTSGPTTFALDCVERVQLGP
jgi:hypothetical protein